jgi:hypothetical protein
MEIDPRHVAFSTEYVRRSRLRAIDPSRFVMDRPDYPGTGSPLLVPVDVQALVVAEDGAVDHADIAVHLLDAEQFAPDQLPTADPFTAGAGRPRGVYVQWAMPDSLTRQRAADDGTLAPTALPDRWLVLRLQPGSRRDWAAWVLESEYGRARALPVWPGEPGVPQGEPPAGYVPRESLSATAGGDPAWAAVFDNVADRFGFHDPLHGVPPGEILSYVVVGWYGDQRLDPLASVRTEASFDQVLKDLQWSIAREARERAQLLDLMWRWAGATATAAPTGPMAVDAAEGFVLAEHPALLAGLRTERERWAEARPDEADFVAPSRVWPRRCVFHGAVYGVRTGAAAPDHRPSSDRLTAAVGATATEALARLIGEKQPGGGAAEETATAAFAYGLIDRLGEHDGPSEVDEAMHTRAFESQPGGYTVDWIRQGDRLAGVRPDRPAPPSDVVADFADQPLLDRIAAAEFREVAGPEGIGAALGNSGVLGATHAATAATSSSFTASFEFAEHAGDLGFVRRTRRELIDGLLRERTRFEQVRRARPRWFQPQDPVIAVQGTDRNVRHGYDGRFTPDATVACRLRWDVQDSWNGIEGADLLARAIVHDSLPPEAAHLVHEAALEDPSNVEGTIDRYAADSPVSQAVARVRARKEIVIGRYGRDPDLESTSLAAASDRVGTMSSPVAVTEWTGQPWIPIYLEWEIELDLGDRSADWTLGELDLAPPSVLATPGRKVLSGRSLVTSGSVKAMADEIRNVLQEEDLRDWVGNGQITEAGEAALHDVAQAARRMDVLSAGLSGLRDHLLGVASHLVLQPRPDGAPPAAPAPGDPPPEPLPNGPALLARAGVIRLLRARIVDAYGRSVDVPTGGLLVSDQLAMPRGVRLATDPETGDTGTGPRVLLRPRINAPTRLLLRLVDAEDDRREVSIDQRSANPATPVAGWLVPDHIDHALEVFAADGTPAGQLRHDVAVAPDVGGAVVWEGAPGRPGPTGVSPGELISSPHVRSLVTRLVERDLVRREAPDAAERESPMSALLRALDTTQWTVDPVSRLGWEFPGALVGRPLAIVRARLTLEVDDDLDDERWASDPVARGARQAAFDRLRSRTFEVRLGSLTRLQDGLFGYYLDDDYWRVHPVHPSVLHDAVRGGPGQGYQQDADRAARFDPADDAEQLAIRDPYVSPDPTITLRPGQTRTVTLLMDPGLSVHVTSGILPRKEITLLRDWVAEPLRVLAPSFRIGPVLVDPTTIRMPRLGGMPGEQVWTHRDSATTWRDDPIEAATQEARLPDGAHVTQEGWIRLVYEQETSDG